MNDHLDTTATAEEACLREVLDALEEAATFKECEEDIPPQDCGDPRAWEEEAKNPSWPEEDDPTAGRSNYDLTPTELDRKGQRAACRFLERRGYEILDTNWRCPAGEAHIVALGDDALCFVEVSTRLGVEEGFPDEAVTIEKRARCERIAAHYLADRYPTDTRVRFDLISILVLGEERAFLRMHTNAFSSGDVR